MFVAGTKASKIGQFELDDGTQCGYCGAPAPQRVSVYGKYVNVYWVIPVFPIGRTAVAECVSCKKTYEESAFKPSLLALYEENKKRVKRPIWHWLGLIIIGLVIGLFTFIISSDDGEVDYRDSLLENDLNSMSSQPTAETDSISYDIKMAFDAFVNEELDPANFEYLTRVKEDKALILVKIPSLKKVEKSDRKSIIEIIKMITNTHESLNDKLIYIGVHGKFNMMMLSTPTEERSGNFISDDPLYSFYGQTIITK